VTAGSAVRVRIELTADEADSKVRRGVYMTPKNVPFTRQEIEKIIALHPTPFHLYDEAAMRANARDFNRAFAWAPGFRNYSPSRPRRTRTSSRS